MTMWSTAETNDSKLRTKRVGFYDHLDPVCLPLDLDELARLLVRSNYGVQRFLSALVRARESELRVDYDGVRLDDRLAREIRRLLEEGEY